MGVGRGVGRGSGLNLHGRFSYAKKAIVVKHDGPSPAFARPFVMKERDKVMVATAELVEAVEYVEGANRRARFLYREAAKKAQVEEEEDALMKRLSGHPTYGRRGIINARFRLRGCYYPTFAPYFEGQIARLTALNMQPKRVAEKDAFMDELDHELDSWTFKTE